MERKTEEQYRRTAMYILQMRPIFNKRALFSDETENYVSPMEPEPGETVTIRFRTAVNNADEVLLITDDQRLPMEYEKTVGSFDFYRIRIRMGETPISYYFGIRCGKLSCYYTKLQATDQPEERFYFRICPGFHTPEWAKGAVMYQILIDRFRNGDPSNDVLDNEYIYIGEGTSNVKDWNKRPATMGVREFYGGDIRGVMEKLDYLQDLGVEVLYFNPLFVSPSNHKYDIQDYDHIDPHLGTFVVDEGNLLERTDRDNTRATRYITRVTRKENLEATDRMFVELVQECHRRGMKVILDGVFNHCGSFNKWMDRERIYEYQPGYKNGAFVSGTSPYRSFFHFTDETSWPYNPNYDGWWGHATLPKLNYENSPMLEDYIMQIGRKWVSEPFCVDGWRLDVAADLGHSPEYNHRFWKRFRKEVKDANPNAVILAEHYGDPRDWLQGDEWDTVMNYDAFMEPLTWFFTGMEKHSDGAKEYMYGNADSFFDAMRYNMASFTAPSLLTAMNELSNHDHSRFLTRTNRKVGRMFHFDYDAASDGINPAIMREAVVMQMTWPGAPTLYYGDEAGVCGFTDPDNRRTYPWGHEDQEMIAFHRAAIRMHNVSSVLRRGSFIPLLGDYNILAYARFSENEQIIVIFNNNDEEREIRLKVWKCGARNGQILKRIFATDDTGYTQEPAEYKISESRITLRLGRFSSIVLQGRS